ncbi:nicotinate-nucleotide adenylyltransferase [Celeribacter baekdonensis]|uniref:nicotinate-nucleotide adenylyltransferase n=1 Tax=Celeribacter baekdonensis TaxID=875171 RepID=UPI003A8D7E88
MRYDLPYARPGQVIGLLGGSFDPAHEGHVHITKMALKRFNLDRVWWLVSPGNPLKPKGPAAMEKRLSHARAVMDHPRVEITALETHTKTRYTAATLDAVKALYPGVSFVWLMGADNLAQFHLWQDWQGIMATTPVGVIARPGTRGAARNSVAAQTFEYAKLPARASRLLGRRDAPRWCFINVPMSDTSSSEIRAKGDWGEV